jgi:regulator of replication initiation timing
MSIFRRSTDSTPLMAQLEDEIVALRRENEALRRQLEDRTLADQDAEVEAEWEREQLESDAATASLMRRWRDRRAVEARAAAALRDRGHS